MGKLFKAFFFKLSKDLTFRITLIIGLALAVVLSLIYFGIDVLASGEDGIQHNMCTGQSMFFNSISPAQNFGIAIPVNLITFTVLEFTQGTIRNKIITGNSKTKIYFTLFFTGLIFTLSLLFAYVGLCVGLGSIFGGFDINGTIVGSTSLGGHIDATYFVRMLVITLLVYLSITAFTIFFVTLFRNIGPCIPVVIVMIMMLYFSGMIASLMKDTEGTEVFVNVMKYVNPMYALNDASILDSMKGTLAMADDTFIASIVNNSIYTIIFLLGGWLVFRKRDVK